jgi:hypothetical protein
MTLRDPPKPPEEPAWLQLSPDEALVLFAFLTRELWSREEARIGTCLEHPAEAHALHALLQELIPTTLWAGDPNAPSTVFAEARERLLARHS